MSTPDSRPLRPEASPLRVRFVGPSRRYHAGPSGYERLTHYLRGASTPEPPATIARAGRAATGRLPEAWRAKVLSPVENRWYGGERLLRELATLPLLIGSRNAVVHHLYAEESYRLSGLAPRCRGAVLVGTYHQPARSLPDFVGDGIHLRRLDALIGVSRDLTRALAAHAGSARAYFVPHGVDTSFFTPEDTGAAVSGGPFRCLFVGYWLRDFDTLDQVLVELAGDDVAFDLVLTPGKARRFAGRPGVHVHTSLSDEDLRATYRRADALVLPLIDSTANNAVLEAMACAVPVVTNETSGIRDYLDDDCAVIAPPRDAGAISAAVRRLATDREAARALGRAGRQRAEREFAWPVIARRIEEVYRECLRRS